MKVICEKRKEIEIVKSCRKEFCCKGLEKAFETIKSESSSYGSDYTSNIRVSDGRVEMIIHANYNCHYDFEELFYCPFCGAKFVVEQIEIDNTGLKPQYDPSVTYTLGEREKKKHWWN